MPSPRALAGALLHDALPFEWHLRRRWQRIHNRDEQITIDGLGVRCEWKWTLPVHYCGVVPSASRRLLRRALRDWPIHLADDRARDDDPEVTFLIGHRGTARLPHLLMTLRSIAAQRGARVECLVIEQSVAPEARDALPKWVRYLHTPIANANEPYRRAATFNEGVKHARGRVLVLHDNDMLVPADYAAELVRGMASGFDALDLKRFIFYLTEAESRRVMEEGRVIDDAQSEVVIQNLRGGSVAITAEAYRAIGGMDESFVGWGGEDVEFWERAETRPVTAFGYLPIVHLWHAAQPEKLQGHAAPAVGRYFELAAIPAEERIAKLVIPR